MPPLGASGGGQQLGNGDPTEVLMGTQGDQVVLAAAATLTPVQLTNGIIQYTAAGANNLTLPLATDLDALLVNARVNSTIKFMVMATGAGVPTLVTNTGWTLVGSGAVTAGTTIVFTARRTAVGAWTLYRGG